MGKSFLAQLTFLSLHVIAAIAQIGAPRSDFYRISGEDRRLCPSPYCGGFFLKRLNVDVTDEKYVFQVNLPSNAKSAFDLHVSRHGPTLVLLRGFLLPYAGYPDVQILNATAVWIGLPLTNETTTVDRRTFYSISNKIPAQAILLNQNRAIAINKSTIAGVSPVPLMDTKWQRTQIISFGALITATLQGAADNKGLPTLKVLATFIRVPVKRVACPLFKIGCNTGVVVYKRTTELCFVPSCNVKPLPCKPGCPRCPFGYKLSGWVGRSGCPEYVCDPPYVPTTSKLSCKV